MSDDYHFSAEYAKSGRSSCRSCKASIGKDELRMGVMVQSPHFDGRIPQWYHFSCFWRHNKSVKWETDIQHFENLRWEDQEKIRAKIGGGNNGAAMTNAQLTDFLFEYSKNSSAKCRECGDKILKNEVRVGRQQKTIWWYHLACFASKKKEFGFTYSPENIPGYESLDDIDKDLVLQKLKDLKRPNDDCGASELEADSVVSTKRKKAKAEKNGDADKLEPGTDLLKKQSNDLWKLRDQLTSALSKKEWSDLLTSNDQEIPSGEAKILDRLTDCMLFGALAKCTECKGGQLVYSTTNNAYVCTGHVSGFTPCQYFTKTPKRIAFEIPEAYEDVDFLAKFQFKLGRQRVFPPLNSSSSSLASPSGAASTASSRPFLQMKFAVLPGVSNETKEAIRENGGSIVAKVDATVVALLAPKDSGPLTGIKSDGKDVVAAKNSQVHIVAETFVDEAKQGNVAGAIEKHKLCDWGSDVAARMLKSRVSTTSAKSSSASKSDAQFTKSVPSSEKQLIKGGAAVDAKFENSAVAHIYQDKKKVVYSAVLGKADVKSGTNSYYKLQLYEHDAKKIYWVFRAWGRTGTTIGSTKTDSHGGDLDGAKEQFKEVFLEKTGNHWDERDNFVKKPYLFYPLDIDYGQDDEGAVATKVEAGSKSTLSKPVQELIKFIFDIEQMKQTMKEFEIDLKKMPLGKLSKKQIKEAYQVLTELQGEVGSPEPNQTKILDCSNRFFTLIPHDFGMLKPPLLDNIQIVQSKTEMLDNLLDIEIAYGILKADTGDEDPLDAHYAMLKTSLEVLDKESNDFKMIQDYVKNTHAATHAMYELEIEEVFLTDRQGEKDRYAECKDMHNRMLLWHGSRTSNYVGILSQGLRIAPPEAPVTGYMFGKGVYFADMVSKSANYCYTGKSNPTGLIMLCEVALGDMQEYTAAYNVTTLPSGKQSVKGVGQTAPDPNGAVTLDNGTVVPMGKGVDAGVGRTSLLYNEYIVYDVAQVNIKYLIKLKFHFKY